MNSLESEHLLKPASDSAKFQKNTCKVKELFHVRGCSRSLLLVMIRCKLGILLETLQCNFFGRRDLRGIAVLDLRRSSL